MSRSADVAVIGSGVAGSLIAWKLSQQGRRVVIFESGPTRSRQQLYQGYLKKGNDHFYPPVPEVFNALTEAEESEKAFQYFNVLRLAGGTTWHWGGTCLRFVEDDFELKSRYGVGVDWPISYQEILPYYREAEKELGVSGDFPESLPHTSPTYCDKRFVAAGERVGMPMTHMPIARLRDSYDGRPGCAGFNNCWPICPTGAHYAAIVHLEKAMAAGAELRPEALVTQLKEGRKGKIETLTYRNAAGESHDFRASQFILAANGVENVRLLMLSKLASKSNALGHYLMTHPGGEVFFHANEPLYSGRGPRTGYGYFGLTSGAHRSEDASGYFNVSNVIDPVRDLADLEAKGFLGKAFGDAFYERIIHQAKMYLSVEQLPEYKNHLRLDFDQKDITGLPKLVAFCPTDSYSERGLTQMKRSALKLAEAMGCKDFQYSTKTDESHIMGATRMGTDEVESVVDPNCCSHEHRNLFVLGGSVFPTGSCVNPTLTIAALTLRLARHFK
ncbi:MAG: GMC family oxidoreductase [Verrucomicrobiota bacterium]